VVSVGGKVREKKLVQVSIRETNESEPFEEASLKNSSVVETRCMVLIWDKPVRGLMTRRVAAGVERA
jgi:hypothetical protein